MAQPGTLILRAEDLTAVQGAAVGVEGNRGHSGPGPPEGHGSSESSSLGVARSGRALRAALSWVLMGLFEKLFGGSKPAPKKRRKKARPQSLGNPFEADPAERVPLLIARELAKDGLKVKPADCTPDTSLVELGVDLLDIVELTMAIEEHYEGKVSFDDLSDEASARLTVGDVIDTVSKALGRPQTKAPQAKTRSKPHGPGHILRCPHCDAKVKLTSSAKRRKVKCPKCKTPFLDLGPLPLPLPDLPMGGPVTELRVPKPIAVELAELPRWVCPWCGNNVGKAADCRRCGCDLGQVARQSLQGRAADEPAEVRGSFFLQATHPMSREVALCRLRRLPPRQVAKIGGTPELADAMRPEPEPPGVQGR
jgi:acyl carrier protein